MIEAAHTWVNDAGSGLTDESSDSIILDDKRADIPASNR